MGSAKLVSIRILKKYFAFLRNFISQNFLPGWMSSESLMILSLTLKKKLFWYLIQSFFKGGFKLIGFSNILFWNRLSA